MATEISSSSTRVKGYFSPGAFQLSQHFPCTSIIIHLSIAFPSMEFKQIIRFRVNIQLHLPFYLLVYLFYPHRIPSFLSSGV